MPRVRGSWLVVAAVVVVILAVPELRRLAHPAGSRAQRAVAAILQGEAVGGPALDPMAPYRERASRFVGERYPRDPEMLLAAGLLTADDDTKKRLLAEAAETHGLKAAWAAYVIELVERGPTYHRFGGGGVDPSDPEQVRSELEYMREAKQPERLDPDQAGPILAAARAWAAADPENGLPDAVQFHLLYGLHRDAEALAAWERAGRKATVNTHGLEEAAAVARLLERMGVSKPDALLYAITTQPFPTLARLRSMARYAQYEGRRAQLAGDMETAVRWWHGTMGLARHLQESADTVIAYLVGTALESMGTSYVWQWRSDRTTPDAPGGPLLGGRIYYGKAHEAYVQYLGPAADAVVRDSLVRSKVRTSILRETHVWEQIQAIHETARARWESARQAGALALAMLVVFGLASLPARGKADAAATAGLCCKVVVTLLALGGMAGGVAVIARIARAHEQAPHPVVEIAVGVVLALALVLLVTWVMTRVQQRDRSVRGAAWRGNLRRVLPVTVAVCALLCLGLLTASAWGRAKWARSWEARGSEMAALRQRVGSEWDHPRIPRDAWRAEHPPAL